MALRNKIFPQRTASVPNYRLVRFEKRETIHGRAVHSLAADLRFKLLHARFTIFRMS